MKVNEAMSADVRIARPSQTIQEAARMMAEIDAGALPVGDNDELVGIITDRDIADPCGGGRQGARYAGARDHEPGGALLLRR